MGNIKVDLTDLAKTFFKIRDEVDDISFNKGKGTPPSNLNPGSRSYRSE